MPGTGGFVPWGPDHQAVLALTALGAAALILVRAPLRAADDRWVRRGIAALLAGNELIAWIITVLQGHARVPLQLCDLAFFMTVWALWSLRRPVAELAYFWGLAGSLQAVLTPDVHEPFPSYWWVKFFVSHCGIVLSALYLGLSGRVRPTARSVWRIWLVTNVYAGVAGIANWLFGTNFGYLAHKPMQPSVLDYLGPWPYYIGGMELIALASLSLAYAPFALARRMSQGAA